MLTNAKRDVPQELVEVESASSCVFFISFPSRSDLIDERGVSHEINLIPASRCQSGCRLLLGGQSCRWEVSCIMTGYI